MAQLLKNLSAIRETWVQSLGWEDTLEKGKANFPPPLYPQYSGLENSIDHNKMVNIEIRFTIFFAVKDRDALDSQQKQAQELTVAQIMNSLFPSSDLK